MMTGGEVGMTMEDAVKHLENMKWLLGVNNTTVDDIPLAKVIDNIAALLKAQEPRIMTEADFKNADNDGFIPAWCEEKDKAEVYCECISIGALEDAKFGHTRWWTSRPTDEVRKVTPWKG